jgi:general secretion pathway protein I
MRKPQGTSAHGFTLIEVIVALAIISVVLIAATQVSSSLARNSQRQTQTLLAQICADNALENLRLAAQMPGIGQSSHGCEQAGHQFQVSLTVRSTPNPSFSRVDAQVFEAQTPVLSVSTIIGRY